MRWFTLVSGIIVILYLVAWKWDQYASGIQFNRSWWPALFAPIDLIALLGMAMGTIWLIVSFIKRKSAPSELSLLIFPLLYVTTHMIPTPGYVDGMAHRVQRDFNQQELIEFAKEARRLKIDWTRPTDDSKEKLLSLETKFPSIMRAAELQPRVTLAETYVDFFYGSALVGHWGIRIVDGPEEHYPFLKNEDATYKEALPRVWVYQLPY